MTTYDDQRDALGDFERKSRDNDVKKIMMIATPILLAFMIAIITITPPDKSEQMNAQFHLRDTWDCTHLQQDLVYRGWQTPKQDNSDPYFTYDLKLHDERGCKP